MILRSKQGRDLDEVRNRLASVGVCTYCHFRLAQPDRLHCAWCARKEMRRMRRRIGYQGKKRCGRCRRRGHDARTCAYAESRTAVGGPRPVRAIIAR